MLMILRSAKQREVAIQKDIEFGLQASQLLRIHEITSRHVTFDPSGHVYEVTLMKMDRLAEGLHARDQPCGSSRPSTLRSTWTMLSQAAQARSPSRPRPRPG